MQQTLYRGSHTKFDYNPTHQKKFDTAQFVTELKFEEIREKYFQRKPSRLTGMFSVETIEEARKHGEYIYQITLKDGPSTHYADSDIFGTAKIRTFVFLELYIKLGWRTILRKSDEKIQELLKKVNEDKLISEIIESSANRYWNSEICSNQPEIIISPSSIDSIIKI